MLWHVAAANSSEAVPPKGKEWADPMTHPNPRWTTDQCQAHLGENQERRLMRQWSSTVPTPFGCRETERLEAKAHVV